MRRIDSSNVHEDLFGPGKDGFQGGNPSANQPATFFTPAWCNALQEEIAHVIETAGLTLTPSDNTQLRQAINQIISASLPFASAAEVIAEVINNKAVTPESLAAAVFGLGQSDVDYTTTKTLGTTYTNTTGRTIEVCVAGHIGFNHGGYVLLQGFVNNKLRDQACMSDANGSQFAGYGGAVRLLVPNYATYNVAGTAAGYVTVASWMERR
jgi:hypothetical protein